jgi:hypothetical protein
VARTAILAIKIIADATSAAKGLDSASGGVAKFESGMRKAAGGASVVVASLVGLGKAAFDEASNLQQAKGAVESVFKSQAPAVDALAKNAANAVGLAQSEYSQLAAVLGTQLKNVGVAQKDLVGTTDGLITTGADLAAMFGGTTADAVGALSSALKGELDPLEKFGVSMTQTSIQAEALAMGIAKPVKNLDEIKLAQQRATLAQLKYNTAVKKHGKGSEEALQAQTSLGAAQNNLNKKMKGSNVVLTANQKAMATMSLITKQTSDATGTFAKESDTAAGAQARAAAATKNALADLGSVLLPIVAQAATLFAQLATYVSQNARTFQILAGVVGGLAVAILAVNAAMTVFRAVQTAMAVATKAAAAAQWLLNVAMSANPIGLIIIAVALLIAGFVLLYRKSETFRAAVDKLWAGMKAGLAAVIAWFQRLGAAVVVIAGQIKAWFTATWNAIKAGAAALVAAVKAYLTGVGARANAIANAVKATFARAWSAVKSAASSAVNFVKTYLRGMQTTATSVASAVLRVFKTAFNAVKSAATSVASAVKSAFNQIKAVVSAVATAVSSKLKAAFNAARSAGAGAARAIMAPFNALKGVVNSIIGAVERLASKLRNLKVPHLSFPKIPSVYTRSAGTLTTGRTAATNGLLAAPGTSTRAGTSTAGGGGVVVNVTGALDPEAVARQIERILGGAQRRRSGVTLRARAGTAAAPVGGR